MLRGRLGDAIPSELPEELCSALVAAPGLRIERIVSRGHSSPPGFWYDQEEAEFVLLVAGRARLAFESRGELELAAGDWIHLPPHLRHRVVWTDPAADTVWLAVFHRSTGSGAPG